MARRIRRCSTLPVQHCCPKEFPAPPNQFCYFKSGGTGQLSGKLCRSIKQERIMGRTKLDSFEFENKPSDSHVARTDQGEFGHIFRRNMPYGSVNDHGTMFV